MSKYIIGKGEGLYGHASTVLEERPQELLHEQLVNDLDAYGPGGSTPAVAAPPMEIEPEEPSVIM